MAVRGNQRIRFWTEVLRHVTIPRVKVYANLVICGGIFAMGWRFGTPSIAIGAMAFVQSVNLSEMIEAYQTAKRHEPPPIRTDDETRRNR